MVGDHAFADSLDTFSGSNPASMSYIEGSLILWIPLIAGRHDQHIGIEFLQDAPRAAADIGTM